jgi:hypothetical protein
VALRASVGVVGDAMSVWIQARQQARTARRAERRDCKRIQEPGALARDAIHVGRLQEWMSRTAKIVPAHVVDENHDDVRRDRAC